MALRDTWHKTLVYFGLAEEDDYPTEERQLPEPEEELEDRYRERPNVRRLESRRRRRDQFKDSVPVIINLQGTDTELSKRLIDFASGLTYALEGGMQRIADKVFLLTPRNVEVSAEERARLIEKGFFNQS